VNPGPRVRARAVILAGAVAIASRAAASDLAAERVRSDAALRRPLVAHVVVALCDNANQGIVPVSRALGNGQDPAGNLYWGARFGVKTYFSRADRWKAAVWPGSARSGVLDRAAFRSSAGAAPVYVLAEAWDGARIREAIEAFLEMASGRRAETVTLDGLTIQAGGAAHLVAFVGHNGLMDFEVPVAAPGSAAPGRAAVVLACASKPYFEPLLARGGAQPLLLTTGLMAPEAYSLEAAVRSWFASPDPVAVRRSAAEAYHAHQRCGLTAARRLFAAGR
jgi:hypothetical protein